MLWDGCVLWVLSVLILEVMECSIGCECSSAEEPIHRVQTKDPGSWQRRERYLPIDKFLLLVLNSQNVLDHLL